MCLHWGLQTHLKVGAKALGQAIHSWAKHAEYQQQGLGVATAASTQAPGSGVGSEAEEELEEEVAPKALADLVEALVGAVFVDSGGDMQATMKVRPWAANAVCVFCNRCCDAEFTVNGYAPLSST